MKLNITQTAEPESEAIRHFLYNIVRELLLNVVKHAGTDQVEITLCQTGDSLHLQVEDFGKGFQPPDIGPGKVEDGFGLASLSGRLELLGGKVNVDSAPGKGTRVQLRVPVKGDLHQTMP